MWMKWARVYSTKQRKGNHMYWKFLFPKELAMLYERYQKRSVANRCEFSKTINNVTDAFSPEISFD